MQRKLVPSPLVLVVGAGLVGLVGLVFGMGSDDFVRSVTRLLALLVAAAGLNVAAGSAGLPSLGQGAFVGLGAYSVAILRAKAGWDPLTATLAAVVIASAAGAFVAQSVARLRPPFVALGTWIGSFIFAASLTSFSGISGGSSGIVLDPVVLRLRALGLNATLGPRALMVIAAVAAAGTFALARIAQRRWGPAMALLRADPGVARAAGVRVAAIRWGALVASAAAGGLAGALLVQSEGVADPTAYGPLLSVKLLIVVVLGGAGTMIGPVAGLLALAVLGGEAALLTRAFGVAGGAADAISVALALGVIAALRGVGIVSAFSRRQTPAGDAELPGGMRLRGASIEVDGVGVTFGAVTALESVSFTVEPGECRALIGPNGSGKTTLVRILSGAVPAAQGEIRIDGVAVPTDLSMRGRIEVGLTRTLQRATVPAGESVLDAVLAGAEPIRTASAAQVLAGTPASRLEQRRVRTAAVAALHAVGLHERAHDPIARLTTGERRLVDIARALVTSPRVLVLDEPSAGIGADLIEPLRAVIASLRDAGLTIILIEHNLRLVRDLADRVIVLDAGRVIADGSLEQVAADAQVRSAYLGEAVASLA